VSIHVLCNGKGSVFQHLKHKNKVNIPKTNGLFPHCDLYWYRILRLHITSTDYSITTYSVHVHSEWIWHWLSDLIQL